jgi:hypothetical protein
LSLEQSTSIKLCRCCKSNYRVKYDINRVSGGYQEIHSRQKIK